MKVYTLNEYLRDTYGEKIYKLAIDAGFTCPNRDGTVGTGGCTFCSEGGSGDFARRLVKDYSDDEVAAIIESGKEHLAGKYHGNRFIAYFQAYTNTYAPVEKLRDLYRAFLNRDEIAGLSIGTRPDCLPDDVIALLDELQKEYPDKFIWIELGLQSANEETARRINRGYANDVFEKAMSELASIGIKTVIHVIIGLPGEGKEDVLETVRFVSKYKPFGVKLQLLHVLKGTALEREYNEGKFEVLSMDEYLDILEACLEELPEGTVVHRMTGDGPKRILVAPMWSADKKKVINAVNKMISGGD